MKIESRLSSLKAHIKANPASISDPQGGLKVQQQVKALFGSADWIALDQQLIACTAEIPKLRLVLTSGVGSNLILHAFKTGKSSHSSAAFATAATGHTIFGPYMSAMCTSDPAGTPFTRAAFGLFTIDQANLTHLRNFDLERVGWLKISQDYMRVMVSGLDESRFGRTIGDQPNFLELCFPVIKRTLRAIGVDPRAFPTFEEQLIEYLESSGTSQQQTTTINEAFNLFMEETGVALRHFVARPDFGITRPPPPTSSAACMSRLRQAILAGDNALRSRHEHNMTGSTGTAAQQPGIPQKTLTKKPAATPATPQATTATKGGPPTAPGSLVNRVELSKSRQLIRFYSNETYDIAKAAADITTNNKAFGTIDLATDDAWHMAAFFARGEANLRARFVAANCPPRFLTEPFTGFKASDYASKANFI